MLTEIVVYDEEPRRSDSVSVRSSGDWRDAMKAIAVERGEDRPGVVEIERPTPGSGEVLLRTLRVGIDGTDHEVVWGNHGGFPAGDDYQILGHEAVAVVEDANGTALQEGELVVPTVRRPAGARGSNGYFERGEPDMAPEGSYVERGIVGAHGYMAEYVTSRPEYLVSVPDSFARHGFHRGDARDSTRNDAVVRPHVDVDVIAPRSTEPRSIARRSRNAPRSRNASPIDDWTFEIDGGQLHRELVLHNKAVFGSVNSNASQYELARETLGAFPEWFVDDLITEVYSPEGVEEAFETGQERIKTVVEFESP